MICRNPFRILDDEEKSLYQFERCQLCACYPCEIVTEHSLAKRNYPNTDIPFHIQEAWDNCLMKGLTRVECGSKRVAEGIGDDFKVEMKRSYKKGRWKWKIVKGTETGRWEPGQWVGISAQTGQGKNWFIENVLLPYIRKLNITYRTDFKVLIISNRIALRLQIESRIKNGLRYRDSEREIIHRYKNFECADVINYQGFLNMIDQLQSAQESELSRYIFVICDEAHFFTSDSMFNYDTGRIMSAILATFKDAVRVYMSATPYECFEYIEAHEAECNKFKIGKGLYTSPSGVLYHFKRDYRYLDIKYYSSHDELTDIIVSSVTVKDENWLVFIDNIEKCKKFKGTLDGMPGMEGKVFAVDAGSKEYRDYQEMICREKFFGDTKVLIATSVIDNGVNFRDIDNIVVSDVSKVKVLQMVGRARVERDDKKTLYFKRFNTQQIENRISYLHEMQDDYHAYDLAAESSAYTDKFRDKYYHGILYDWKNASNRFGRVKDSPALLPYMPNNYYLNEIARLFVDKLVPIYESILEEMRKTDRGQEVTGQKYLEYQLTWFDKVYDKANDITLTGRVKSEDNLIEFLELHATKGAQMFKDEQETFRNEFTKFHDGAFPRRDKNLGRSYGLKVINDILDAHNLNYRVESQESKTSEGKRQHWTVVRFDSEGGVDISQKS